MVPAGLILLVSAILELVSGDYTIGRNRYGNPVGPFYRVVLGVVFSGLGAVAFWNYLRRRKPSTESNEKTPS